MVFGLCQNITSYKSTYFVKRIVYLNLNSLILCLVRIKYESCFYTVVAKNMGFLPTNHHMTH
jgi:hypothetical protein